MNTIYFLLIPLALFVVFGGLIYLVRRPRPTADSITSFASEMGALAPPGADLRPYDPVRPIGYPGRSDRSGPLDVMLADDAELAQLPPPAQQHPPTGPSQAQQSPQSGTDG